MIALLLLAVVHTTVFDLAPGVCGADANGVLRFESEGQLAHNFTIPPCPAQYELEIISIETDPAVLNCDGKVRWRALVGNTGDAPLPPFPDLATTFTLNGNNIYTDVKIKAALPAHTNVWTGWTPWQTVPIGPNVLTVCVDPGNKYPAEKDEGNNCK